MPFDPHVHVGVGVIIVNPMKAFLDDNPSGIGL